MTLRGRIIRLEREQLPVDVEVDAFLEAQAASCSPHPRLAEWAAVVTRCRTVGWDWDDIARFSGSERDALLDFLDAVAAARGEVGAGG